MASRSYVCVTPAGLLVNLSRTAVVSVFVVLPKCLTTLLPITCPVRVVAGDRGSVLVRVGMVVVSVNMAYRIDGTATEGNDC